MSLLDILFFPVFYLWLAFLGIFYAPIDTFLAPVYLLILLGVIVFGYIIKSLPIAKSISLKTIHHFQKTFLALAMITIWGSIMFSHQRYDSNSDIHINTIPHSCSYTTKETDTDILIGHAGFPRTVFYYAHVAGGNYPPCDQRPLFYRHVIFWLIISGIASFFLMKSKWYFKKNRYYILYILGIVFYGLGSMMHILSFD